MNSKEIRNRLDIVENFPIRTMPMSEDDGSFENWTKKEIQDKYFLNLLPKREGVCYHFRTNKLDKKKSSDGMLILFQWKGEIIALAKYKEHLYNTDPEYPGSYSLYKNSIAVFDPISSEEMRMIFTEGYLPQIGLIKPFSSFAQSSLILNPKNYDALLDVLENKNIRFIK